MNKPRITLTALAAFVLTIICASATQAVSFRTHVSLTGSDANTVSNCSRSSPCRNFSAAYGVTSPGGEIIALDSAGFGGLTITTSVTIMALPGQVALTAVLPATSGITVNAGASNVVILRNLQFSGSGAANTVGVTHLGGKLVIENCNFTELTLGVLVQGAKADLIHCNLTKNTTGLRTNGTGCDPSANNCSTGTTQARVSFGNFNFNGTAFQQDNPGLGTCTPGPFTCPPTPLPTRISIYVFGIGGQAATNVTGNTVTSAGTGTGCPDPTSCINIPVYSFNSPNVNP